MPRYCRVKAEEFSENQALSGPYQSICESIIPYLGIDPGSNDEEGSLVDFIWELASIIFDPTSCWFQIFVLVSVSVLSFLLGVYLRRTTIVNLLREKEAWIDKEKMLLSQLWSALEEKLEIKSSLGDSRTTLDKLKIELSAEQSEKESLQTRMWGLDRNLKTLQTERDVLEEKLRDCIVTFTGFRKSMGDGADNAQVQTCLDKVKGLQALMQKLIEAHRQEHMNFIAMLEKQPGL